MRGRSNWFTADTHFGHKGVLDMSCRPFASSEDHDKELISEINTFVKADDTLWVLGDFAFKAPDSYRKQIACKNVNLIWGNHDKGASSGCFDICEHTIETRIDGHKFFLSHYPHAYWPASHYGSFHLYGHMHGEREDQLNALFPGRRAMDVGVDVARRVLGRYRPFNQAEILDLFMLSSGHDNVRYYQASQLIRNINRGKWTNEQADKFLREWNMGVPEIADLLGYPIMTVMEIVRDIRKDACDK